MPQKNKKIEPLPDTISIIFHKSRQDSVHTYEQETVRRLLERLTKKLHTKSPIKRVEIGIDQQKNSAGKTTLFSVTLSLELVSGQSFTSHGKSRIAKTKGVGLTSAIKEAFTDIEAQYKKVKVR
jgi:hypothetical protein